MTIIDRINEDLGRRSLALLNQEQVASMRYLPAPVSIGVQPIAPLSSKEDSPYGPKSGAPSGHI